MQFFDEQTIQDLEFDRIREQLLACCLNPTAAKHMAQLKPLTDRSRCMMELESNKELLDIRLLGERFPAIDFEEINDEMRLLRIQNSVVSQEGFMRIYRASLLVNELIAFFSTRKKEFPRLANLTEIVYSTTDLIESIDKVFDKRGKIKDDASPELRHIRGEIKDVRAKIHKHFERDMKRLIKMGILSDTREGFLNERRVLAVLSSHKREVGGSVLGSSKTGGITYIEPAATLPLNNELELLIDDERKEVFRILKALTKDIALHVELIENYQRLLTRFDFINAKTKFALSINATLPGIDETEQHIELIDAFHPLLWQANQAAGLKTIPQSLLMDKFSRMLVISGPNAGGKSITLKTVGLLQVMLQSGLLVPVHPNSRMGFFQQVLTDIGDNQSIVNQLSTYSYRLKRMKHFLEVANKRSLLLLDEFGTGSDPDLGGALAEVFFETLYNKKCFGVITTHYNNIKLKAGQLKNARNGCMLFDTDSLEPLYQLSIGQPGSSFTFEVAQINGIPQALIEEAKTRMDSKKVLLDEMISSLQKEKGLFEKLNNSSRQFNSRGRRGKTALRVVQKEIRRTE
jgi:DNA mismatch repair protein MutS2